MSKKKPFADRNARKLKDQAELNAEIAARVAPEPRKKNVIKKIYKEGSPGHERKQLGVTLTQLKKSMNERVARVTVMLDDNGQPTGEETTEIVRDTAARTKRRRDYTGRGLLGTNAKTAHQRRDDRRYASANSKGTRPPKKTWHRGSKPAVVETAPKSKKKAA